MKYLSPEIALLSKKIATSKKLAKTNVSCGIFQTCDYSEKTPDFYLKNKLEKNK